MYADVIARLEEQGVDSVEDCALYLTPLTIGGDRMILKDAQGKPLEAIEISLPVFARFKATANLKELLPPTLCLENVTGRDIFFRLERVIKVAEPWN